MAKLLKIKAETAKDLKIISALLQDALFPVGSMIFQKKKHRFAFIANRFCWEAEVMKGKNPKAKEYARTCSALRFEGVLQARLKNIPLDKKKVLLSLLAIEAGRKRDDYLVTLTFSGGGAIQLKTELLEVYLEDLTESWSAKSRPEHPVS